MAYEFFEARKTVSSSQGDYYRDGLQAKVNKDFENASDVYTIKEELTIGTKVFTDTRARVTHIINNDTGKKLSYDFKSIIFKDMNHVRALGMMYQFNNNYWITIDADTYKYPTANSVIRRCNNVLRWISNGQIIEEPCAIDYGVTYTNGDYKKEISLPVGVIRVFCQANNNTNTIGINKRFLFGNLPRAYKIQGIDNFRSNTTFGDNSPVLTFDMYVDNISDKDNLALRIADYYDEYVNPDFPSSGYTNVIIPNKTSLIEGETQVYEVWEYKDGVKTDTKFDISVNGVPPTNYTIIGTSAVNSFSITNLKYGGTLTVNCTNLRDSSKATIDIELRWI